MTFNDRFVIAWRVYSEDGKVWVEETIGLGSSHKTLYGPIPDRKTAEALIDERKKQLQLTLISLAQASAARIDAIRGNVIKPS